MAISLFPYDEIWSHPDKSLKEHLIKTGELARLSIKAIPLALPIEKRILVDVVRLIGLYHDIGKATPFFQEYLREKNDDKKARFKNMPETRHSLISAIATYFVIEEYLKKVHFNNEFTSFLPIVSFLTVRRHHGNLQSATEDLRLDIEETLKKQVKNLYHEYFSFIPYWDTVSQKLRNFSENWPLRKYSLAHWLKRNGGILPYLIQHLLYSLLLDADKHEVTVGSHLERKPLVVDMVENYRKQRGFDNTRRKIDILRNKVYQEVLHQIEALNLDRDRIFSLTAPTGLGKTLTSLAFALKLRSRIINEKKYCPRLIYCLPFLSIIDQNAKEIEKVFKYEIGKNPTSDLFLIHHHLSDYTYIEEDTEYGSDKSEILIEGWDSEIIITTFVQLFHTLFSNRNRAIRKLHKIAGGIVILDEIQSFPHKYWLLFRKMAEAMQKYLGTYFLLSTATQPAIFKNTRELLTNNEKYFKSCKRTQIIIKTALPKTTIELADELIKNASSNLKSTLVVLNTISSAEKLFKAMKKPLEQLGYKIYFLSSHVTPYERFMRIKKIKEPNHKKFVISTQLVEAGVDIDLERVIRDFGPMDSINQVAGRANRNWNISLGKIEIFLLQDEKNQRFCYSYIYDPVLIDNTERILKSYSIVDEENFLALANQYYKQLLNAISDDTSQEYLEAIKVLDYEKISRFRLIEEKGEKVDVFVELNDEATDIWNQYQEAMQIADPRKRKQRFLEVRGEFYNYVISISLPKVKENLPPEVSGFRFISKFQLDEFYDIETGFKSKSEVSIC